MYYFIVAENLNLTEYNILQELFDKYKKWIVSLSNIRDTYFHLIDNHDNSNSINKATFFEFISFLEYCRSKSINSNEIIIIKYFNLFISDNKCFINMKDELVELTKEDTLLSLRQYFKNWLYEVVNYFTNLVIPDKDNQFNFDKLSVVNKILLNSDFNSLKEIYWDLSIFFINDKENIRFIVSKLKEKYNKFVIKNIYSEMWKWVYTFDIDNISFEYKIYKYLENNYRNPLLVFPYFNLETEYRLYYDYFDWKINIYSVKLKENNNIEESFEKWNFHMYKNLDVTRDIYDKKYFSKKENNYIENIIKLLWWKVWVMEFISTDKNDLYLMEVNHLWWLLLYDWQDVENLNQFYIDIYKKMIT